MKLNGKLIDEDNYSILEDDVDVWYGELPWKKGDKFPTAPIKERASISKTNRLLYENDMDKVYNSFLQILPEIEPIYGYQLRELIARLPYNHTSVNYYSAMICGLPPFINGTGDVDIILNTVLENSNLANIITDETRSRFLDLHSVYRVYKYNGVTKLQALPSKNCVAFADAENTSEIKVIVVYNIYKTEKGSSVCEFTEYFNDGYIEKRVFNYSNGTLGREIVELRDSGKAFDDNDECPLIWCRHNVLNSNQFYGLDQFRFWDSSVLMAMREVQNLFRAAERCREIIRKVPTSAVQKDNVTGRSMFINKGTISYDENASDSQQGPDIKYVQPDYNMVQAAINALDSAMDIVSNCTGLGKVFFGIEKAGSNLSAKSIEAMLYPTRLLVTMARNEMTTFVKEAARKIAAVSGIGVINNADLSITWRNSFPYDEKEHTESVVLRYEKGLLTKQDAIAILNDVPARVAKLQAAEIDGNTIIEDDKQVASNIDEFIESNEGLNTQDVRQEPEAIVVDHDGDKDDTKYENGDDIDNPDAPLWESQMPFA